MKKVKRIAMQRAKATHKLYSFEDAFLPKDQMPMAALRALGKMIWRENTGYKNPCPVIVAGRGTWHVRKLVSFCIGRSYIELARHERTRAVLIHEMVHALGPATHGLRFQKRFAYLIGRYL